MFLIDETPPWVLKLKSDKFILDLRSVILAVYVASISTEIVAGL
jgi:hypothetical protein